ncbi:MAG: hypothetical protein HC817_07460 [Saprospiraceae bacterium]|nr:hypothetical protein [Saprospiraceae bacterium]
MSCSEKLSVKILRGGTFCTSPNLLSGYGRLLLQTLSFVKNKTITLV